MEFEVKLLGKVELKVCTGPCSIAYLKTLISNCPRVESPAQCNLSIFIPSNSSLLSSEKKKTLLITISRLTLRHSPKISLCNLIPLISTASKSHPQPPSFQNFKSQNNLPSKPRALFSRSDKNFHER